MVQVYLDRKESFWESHNDSPPSRDGSCSLIIYCVYCLYSRKEVQKVYSSWLSQHNSRTFHKRKLHLLMTSTISNNILESASQCQIQQNQKYSAFTWTIGQLILRLKVYFLELNINIVKSHLRKTATCKILLKELPHKFCVPQPYLWFSPLSKIVFLCGWTQEVDVQQNKAMRTILHGNTSSLAPHLVLCAVSFSSSQDSRSLGHCLGSWCIGRRKPLLH